MQPHYWYDSIYFQRKKNNLFFLEDLIIIFISKLKKKYKDMIICPFYRLPGSNEIGTNFKVVGSKTLQIATHN